MKERKKANRITGIKLNRKFTEETHILYIVVPLLKKFQQIYPRSHIQALVKRAKKYEYTLSAPQSQIDT